ncbi:MAG TPA: YggT family protein [Firmicutes bacterium]|nr:YggT family protein [Bacillota bacterium]
MRFIYLFFGAYPVSGIISLLFRVFYYILLLRIIFSFIPLSRGASQFLFQLKYFCYRVTEPILAPFRKFIPPLSTGAAYLDLSPLIALFVLNLLRNFLLMQLRRYGL